MPTQLDLHSRPAAVHLVAGHRVTRPTVVVSTSTSIDGGDATVTCTAAADGSCCGGAPGQRTETVGDDVVAPLVCSLAVPGGDRRQVEGLRCTRLPQHEVRDL